MSDMRNIAAQEMDEIISLLNKFLSETLKTYQSLKRLKLDRKKLNDLRKFVNTNAYSTNEKKPHLGDKKLMFQITGLDQKEVQLIFKACGANLTLKEDGGDKQLYLFIWKSQMNYLKSIVEKLNAGELSLNDISEMVKKREKDKGEPDFNSGEIEPAEEEQTEDQAENMDEPQDTDEGTLHINENDDWLMSDRVSFIDERTEDDLQKVFGKQIQQSAVDKRSEVLSGINKITKEKDLGKEKVPSNDPAPLGEKTGQKEEASESNYLDGFERTEMISSIVVAPFKEHHLGDENIQQLNEEKSISDMKMSPTVRYEEILLNEITDLGEFDEDGLYFAPNLAQDRQGVDGKTSIPETKEAVIENRLNPKLPFYKTDQLQEPQTQEVIRDSKEWIFDTAEEIRQVNRFAAEFLEENTQNENHIQDSAGLRENEEKQEKQENREEEIHTESRSDSDDVNYKKTLPSTVHSDNAILFGENSQRSFKEENGAVNNIQQESIIHTAEAGSMTEGYTEQSHAQYPDMQIRTKNRSDSRDTSHEKELSPTVHPDDFTSFRENGQHVYEREKKITKNTKQELAFHNVENDAATEERVGQETRNLREKPKEDSFGESKRHETVLAPTPVYSDNTREPLPEVDDKEHSQKPEPEYSNVGGSRTEEPFQESTFFLERTGKDTPGQASERLTQSVQQKITSDNTKEEHPIDRVYEEKKKMYVSEIILGDKENANQPEYTQHLAQGNGNFREYKNSQTIRSDFSLENERKEPVVTLREEQTEWNNNYRGNLKTSDSAENRNSPSVHSAAQLPENNKKVADEAHMETLESVTDRQEEINEKYIENMERMPIATSFTYNAYENEKRQRQRLSREDRGTDQKETIPAVPEAVSGQYTKKQNLKENRTVLDTRIPSGKNKNSEESRKETVNGKEYTTDLRNELKGKRTGKESLDIYDRRTTESTQGKMIIIEPKSIEPYDGTNNADPEVIGKRADSTPVGTHSEQIRGSENKAEAPLRKDKDKEESNTTLPFETGGILTVTNNIREEKLPENSDITRERQYELNYEKETAQQRQLIKDIEERKRRAELATIVCSGHGKEMIPALQDMEKETSQHAEIRETTEPSFLKTEKTDGLPGTIGYERKPEAPASYDIQINELQLVSYHFDRKPSEFEQAVGQALTSKAQTYKDTETYQGYSDLNRFRIFFSMHSLHNSARAIYQLEAKNLRSYSENDGFFILNTILKEKRAEGFFDRDTVGVLRYGLNFDTLQNTRYSTEMLMIFLEKKGLVRKDKTGFGERGRGERRFRTLYAWDLSIWNMYYKKGELNELIRILGLDMNDSTARETLNEIDKIIRSHELDKMADKHYFKGFMQTLNNLSKKNIQDSATFSGMNQVHKIVKMIKQTVYFTKLGSLAAEWASSNRVVKFAKQAVQKNMIEPLKQWAGKSQNPFMQDVLEKSVQKAERQREKAREKSDKKAEKEARRKARDKKKRDKIDRRKERIKEAGRRVMRQSARIISYVPGGKTTVKLIKKGINAGNAIKGGLTKWLSFKGSVAALLSTAKKYILIGIGGIAIFLIIIEFLIIMITNLISVFAFWNEEKTANKLIGSLQKMENDWAEGLKSLGEQQSLDFGSLKFTVKNADGSRNLMSADEYTVFKGWRMENGKIVGQLPFGLTGGDDSLRKRIEKVDKNVEITYEGATGNKGRTSNIKDIISLCATYFENETELKDYSAYILPEDVLLQKEVSLKKATDTMQSWIVKPNLTTATDTPTDKLMEQYCTLLFGASHQEEFDMEYHVLPINGTYDSTNPPEEVCQENGGNGEGNGCMMYDKFYYNANGISLSANGAGLGSQVIPAEGDHDCYATNSTELMNVLIYASGCYKAEDDGTSTSQWFKGEEVSRRWLSSEPIDASARVNTYGQKGADTNVSESKIQLDSPFILHASADNVTDRYRTAISDMIQNIEAGYGNDFEENIENPTGENGVFRIRVGSEEKKENRTVEETETAWENGILYETTWEVTYEYVQDVYHYVKVTHECLGSHKASYCGGHIKMYVNGVIYGISDEELGSRFEDYGSITAKTDDYRSEPSQDQLTLLQQGNTLIDENRLYAAKDLFDVDSSIYRPVYADKWKGWTEDNMTIAILKYNQDWNKMYGITFASALGGEGLSETTIEDYLHQIKSRYPDTSEERLAVIEDALRRVGSYGYDQTHHNCPLDGPCIYGTGVPCYLSDCSGFVSYIWYSRLGRTYTTATFYSTFKDSWIKFNAQTAKPGDILLHYAGNIGDGVGDHALLYLGAIRLDGSPNLSYVTIDCTTKNGAGNVYVGNKGDRYISQCYVVKPD